MAKLNELKPDELIPGLTAEQKKAIFADFIKTNKEDADKIIGSDAPSELKKELTEFIEQRNEGIKEQIKDIGESVQTIKGMVAEHRGLTDDSSKKPSFSLGEYMQVLAKQEIAKHEPGIRLSDEQINKFSEAKKKAVTSGSQEGDFSSGGSFLTPDYSSELIRSGYESSGIINMCRTMTTTGNSMKFRAIDDYDKSSGYVSGAVIMYWVNELATATASKPTTSAYTIELCKLMGLSYSSIELIEDSPISIETQLKSDFADAFSLAMDDVILNGMGASQPEGILNAPCLVSQAIESGQDTTEPVKSQNIMNMWAHMRSSSQRRAVWVINPDLLPYLPQMNIVVGLAGQPVFLPMNSLANQPYMTLYGRPIIVNECAQAKNTKGDIFLADFNNYVILTKSGGGLRYETSIHVEFIYDNMTFKFVYRIGGRPIWKTYQTARRGSMTMSPFVSLDTRS